MNQQTKTAQIEDERRVEKEYKEALEQRAKTIAQYEGPANGPFVGTGLPPKRVYGNTIAGRVALVTPDDDILDGKSEFYIGETYAFVDGVNVFSWATPIARTFYQGNQRYYEGAEQSYRGPDRHPLCTQVAAVRAFRHVDGRIVNFVDEPRRSDAPALTFAPRGRLDIARPSTLPKFTVPSPPKQSDEAPRSDIPESPATMTGAVADDLPPVRVEELLREQLLAPRTASLTPVLSTLQPDQYELVTMTGQHSVIIEGHPGTGKTIVATHRAAYLVHEDIPDEDRLTGNILVVGPTPGYSRHVRGVINRLAGPTSRIAVFSLPELADLIIGRSEAPPIGVSRSYHDVGWEIARFARSVIAKFRADAGENPLPAEVIEALKTRAGLITDDQEWAAYLRGLPDYREAAKLRVHSPLIAFIHWELERPPAFARVEHVIVDEAQDVTPLEWLLLDEINEGDKWTLIGDLNQRRSDHTLPDWNQVLDHIAIEPDTPVRRMRRGYRSTKPILDFANRLLPRPERKINAFQQVGPEPRIRSVKNPQELGDTVAQEVDRLLVEYPEGTLAVICQTPTVATSGLRKRGWSANSISGDTWSCDGRDVKVLIHDAARGLEFDAVVVVEPSEFPKNFGRFGPLYTALTRANRELAVVHSAKLPRELLKH